MIEIIIIGTLGVATLAGLLCFWNHIADFMLRYALPWLKEVAPNLESVARDLFRHIDRVTVAVIQAVRQGWAQLRKWLIGQLVEYERKSSNVYVQRVITYFRQGLESGGERNVERTEERTVDVSEIPFEFRDQVIGRDRSRINLTRHVEEAMDQMALKVEA